MENVPKSRVDIPNHTNYQPEAEMVRLRRRLGDLLRLGAATPDTFQMAVQQMWQETEKRRQSCLQEAEDHLRKYHAMVAQAHGFSSMASILYSVIDGYVNLEERRIQEAVARATDEAKAAEPPPFEEDEVVPPPAATAEEKSNGSSKRKKV